MTRSLLVSALALPLLAMTVAVPRAAFQFGDEEVIFYPTYGFRQGTDWIIPMRAKVQEPRTAVAHFSTLVGSVAARDAGDANHFMSRLADFLTDDESGEDVRLEYFEDVDRKEYRIANAAGRFPETDANGVVEGTLTLPDAVAQRLLTAQGSIAGWLTYRTVSSGHRGTGRVRLIGPAGISVVSDIDDTIKVTEIPAGARIIATNTFFREFVPTTELNAKFTELRDAAFHYVSGGPWQLYRPVSAFLIAGRLFPEGTFHMKSLTGGLRTPIRSTEDLSRFVLPGGTREHKVFEISRIMERFPGRQFVLIGDSGEQDPEVYREIRGRFKARVNEIIIRDVTNARQLKPDRLAGMTVVPAPTVVSGVSQFPR